MVSCVELTQMESASVLIEPLDVLVKPDVLSSDSRNAFRLELDLLDRILGNKVTA